MRVRVPPHPPQLNNRRYESGSSTCLQSKERGFDSLTAVQFLTMKKTYRQYNLRSDDARRVGWLESDRTLRRGTLVKLVGDERWWEITDVYMTPVPAPPEKRWQVGGLL
jgi:hypothetical protein